MSIQLGAPTLGGVVNSNGEHHDSNLNLPPVTSYTTVNPGQPATVVDVQPVQVQQPQQQVVYSDQPQSVVPVQPQVVESATIVQTQPVPAQVHADGDEMARTSSVKFDNPATSSDSLRAAEVRRDRAGSTATTRSTLSTATTGTSATSSIGGTTGDGEDCVKEKRVKEWNKHFEVEQGEGVVCTHGCALVVSGVMIHGRIYMTERNIYFRANIVGIVTKRQIPISSITSISPKNVAGSIPNAIEILHEPLAPGRNSSIKSSSNNDGDTQRSLFTTLPKRDHTMGILVGAWRKQAPEAYERAISGGGGDASELARYGDGNRPRSASTAASTHDNDRGYESSSSSSSTSTVGRNNNNNNNNTSSGAGANGSSDKSGVEQQGGGSTGGDGSSRGPHPATKADTPDLDKQALHTRLPSEPKKVYELLYHKEEFLRGIWEGEGMTNIQIQPWTNGKRTISYSRPLGGKIGSTKCEGEETIIQPDGCEDWWGVEGITRTPGVPAGKSFFTRSKTVFTYAEGGGTLMHATYQVEWTGKSMLKSTINGQAETGQQKWNDLLAKNLRKYIKEHPDEFPSSGNDEDIDEPTEAASAASKSDEAGTPSTTTGGDGSNSRTTTSNVRANAAEGEFDPIGWVMEDPLRAAISAVLVTIILLYLWSLVKGLFGHSTVQISKKRLAQLEKFEAMFLKHGHPTAAAAVQPGPDAVAGARVTTETVIKKVVRPR